jgi:TatD DNase family protein
MFFDTHAHYDDKAFDDDREELLNSLFTSGVDAVIDPGCDLASSRKAAAIAEKFSCVWFAAGIHPEELTDIPEDYPDVLRSLAAHPKCVAIGEIGLDYYWDASQKTLQKEIFEAQLKLADELSLPVIIHDREAHGDCLEIVKRHPESFGVFHCYSGSAEMAHELLKMGWYIGFDGPVTYKNARKTIEVLEITPLNRILIETDSPYLSPVPMRGKRNDSGNLKYIAEKIAQVKGVLPEELADITRRNAETLFRI